ncbi:alanine racemase [Maridesulfovibrio salexigens]|uniref:Alanine racemase n=1 Tax=Maridesulfovibrio salexigens (strain ATCC 14822 / DSM 2638 / NCIMB 8403 / VKM B-1763) TaxID=526222 RepID=C6BRX2_MARSD|nr:alanine racemase [Maridesulfovibrio salexigens]ACS81355.1 alanine racemase [Maridesulfovibrio salexigens DSM 2638]
MNNPKTFAPIWAEVDLSAISHNFSEVQRLVNKQSKIMAVVKADAYGHGLTKVADCLNKAGADYFAVARLDEAVALRNHGIEKPILILGYTPPEAATELLKHKVIQTVFSSEYAKDLNEKLNQTNKTLKVHIKIDTGMGRLGLVDEFNDGAVLESISTINRLPNLETEGVYTHFAASDEADKTSALEQLKQFKNILAGIERRGISIPLKHAANSAAIIDLPESYFDMVRPGIMLYGLYPSNGVHQQNAELRPAMQIKARIAQTKEVPAGFRISYGHTYTTPNATKLATIPLGYADGYRRQLSSAGKVLVHGQHASIVGRVCMDQSVIDVGKIENVEAGDEVVIIGRQEQAEISAERMACELGTINYEIVSTLMARVPRIFKDS